MVAGGIKKRTREHVVGIDTADGSVELVDLHLADEHVSFTGIARVTLSSKTIVHGLIEDEQDLLKSIKHLITEAHSSSNPVAVITALPDSQVIVQNITLKTRPSYNTCAALAHEAALHIKPQIANPVVRWNYVVRATDSNHGQLVVFMTSRD